MEAIRERYSKHLLAACVEFARKTLPFPFELTAFPTAETLEEIYRLRVLAWRTQAEIPHAIKCWVDPEDGKAVHFAILNAGLPIAAIRLSVHEKADEIPSADVYRGVLPTDLRGPIASYNRMVVHPDFRGKGLSKTLDLLCLESARKLGARCLVGATGSVKENQRRIASMIKIGFKEFGPGNRCSSNLYTPDNHPTVLVFFFDDGCREAK